MKKVQSAQSDLRQIPGVGVRTEQDLLRLGYPTVARCAVRIPEELYRRDCAQRGFTIDRCSSMFIVAPSTMPLLQILIPSCSSGGNGRISSR